MKELTICLFVLCMANCAIFNTFNSYPSSNTQPNNIWNQPSWYPPSYTPPQDTTAPDQNQADLNPPIEVGAAAANPSTDIKQIFAQFKAKNGKYYNPSTEAYRLSVFTENVKNINANNKDPARTHTETINKFTDLTQAEFVAAYLKAKTKGSPTENNDITVLDKNKNKNKVVITPIDWRPSGKLNPVKDQGACGSCWAFSVVGAVEANVAIKNSAAPGVYSEQQLVDCCGKYSTSCLGCNGGWTGAGFDYIGKIGIADSSAYPYTGLTQACVEETVTNNFYVSATAPSFLRPSGITGMMTYLAKGPISVIVDASRWGPYLTGVLRCRKSVQYNHAVVLVGVEATGVYIVRNSWGMTWGDNGHIRISGRSSENCGILSWMTFPKLL